MPIAAHLRHWVLLGGGGGVSYADKICGELHPNFRSAGDEVTIQADDTTAGKILVPEYRKVGGSLQPFAWKGVSFQPNATTPQDLALNYFVIGALGTYRLSGGVAGFQGYKPNLMSAIMAAYAECATDSKTCLESASGKALSSAWHAEYVAPVLAAQKIAQREAEIAKHAATMARDEIAIRDLPSEIERMERFHDGWFSKETRFTDALSAGLACMPSGKTQEEQECVTHNRANLVRSIHDAQHNFPERTESYCPGGEQKETVKGMCSGDSTAKHGYRCDDDKEETYCPSGYRYSKVGSNYTATELRDMARRYCSTTCVE